MQAITRLVIPSDRDSWTALWRDYLAFYGAERPADVYDSTWARICDPEQAMFSALSFRDGRAVGLVNFLYHKSFWDVQDRIYLNDLYVAPDARGAGIGEALVDLVSTHARENDAAQVYWLTAKDNTTARRLYDRIGTLTPFIKYTCP